MQHNQHCNLYIPNCSSANVVPSKHNKLKITLFSQQETEIEVHKPQGGAPNRHLSHPLVTCKVSLVAALACFGRTSVRQTMLKANANKSKGRQFSLHSVAEKNICFEALNPCGTREQGRAICTLCKFPFFLYVLEKQENKK